MHTPGPWKIELVAPFGQGDWHGWAIKGEHGVVTHIGAASQRGPIDIESNRLNAYLIAAAPEMLEALTDLAAAVAAEVDAKPGFGGSGYLLARLRDARKVIATATEHQST